MTEKLSLWDRLFNRYHKEIHRQEIERWRNNRGFEWMRTYVEYRVTDRVTGSVTIEREYLN